MRPTPDIHWSAPVPAADCGTGVLVLAGSSGRLDTGRADLLAARGATAVALRWFGGQGQPAQPCEVPLETFAGALDRLAASCRRVAALGTSYGAEAALLLACHDERIDAVVALAPTDVVWEGARESDDDPPRTKWTLRGEPVPFVPLDRTWTPPPDPAFVEVYERSRARAAPEAVAAATLPVERIGGDVVLVAGGDDRVWDSEGQARRIAARRAAAGLATTVVVDPAAGHPVVLPGEEAPDLRRPYQVGGDAGAPQRLGALAWPAIADALRLARRRPAA
ncbi:acyl-CoA thioester hydrolase/BAAT C-terminal domain-containing protein [Nocardioides kribbensis]|uniref:acyl-CoA thioester hydrolase/BAAT C-terminal domain-containing protein n=1 Tax=Nocardioides kribbensis TaxID=305517 RepID=UPI00187B0155|nr:acyl-CoA thioester hydrolase/BAAT C-terminal domain-containing protein [Nocardioides kribbensis]